jgi:hypothetical protein
MKKVTFISFSFKRLFFNKLTILRILALENKMVEDYTLRKTKYQKHKKERKAQISPFWTKGGSTT